MWWSASGVNPQAAGPYLDQILELVEDEEEPFTPRVPFVIPYVRMCVL